MALEEHLQLMLLLLPLLLSLGAARQETRWPCCRRLAVEVVKEQQILQEGRSDEGEGKVVGDDLLGPETSSREEVVAATAASIRSDQAG